jgi:hypothetical protein
MSTKYFTLEYGAAPGAVCSYCGEKIIPFNTDYGMEFQCRCEQAMAEQHLRVKLEEAQWELEHFLDTRNDYAIEELELGRRAMAHEEEAAKLYQQIKDNSTKGVQGLFSKAADLRLD